MARSRMFTRWLPLGCSLAVGLQGCTADHTLPTQLSPGGLAPVFTEGAAGNIGGDKFAQGFWNIKPIHDWTVEKVLKSPTATPIPLGPGSSTDLTYTITATKSITTTVEISGVTGGICVLNEGSETTQNLAILDQVMISTDGGVTFAPQGSPQPIDTDAHPSLSPGERHCYEYRIDFEPTSGAAYKNTAVITADNFEPLNVSYPFTMPEAAELFNVDNFSDIRDVVTCPTGFTCTPLTPLTGLRTWGWEWLQQGTAFSVDLVLRVTNPSVPCGTFEVENLVDLQEKNVDGSSPDYGAELRTARVVTEVFAGDCTPPKIAGCTPGFWKVKQHWVFWGPTGYATTQSVSSVFEVPADYTDKKGNSLGGQSLVDGLSFQGGSTLGGAAGNLLRAAIAGLLNATHPDGGYAYGSAQVISRVDAALASRDRAAMLTLAGDLDRENNRGCTVKD
jgi:hypothetical protein